MRSNFAFLEEKFPVLANFGKLAEAYLYSDSNSCLMKLGMIGETVVNLMFTYDQIPPPLDNTAVKRIDALASEGLLSDDLRAILHALRIKRNKAAHENYSSVSDGKALLEMTHSLATWFMQTYGDWSYKGEPFCLPKECEKEMLPPRTDVVKAAEEKEEKALEKVTIAHALQEKKKQNITKTDRKKQSQKIASQRPKSEAETRYLIDQALRQVGWEADTEHLRYSQGTRPEKGRYLAIAEWPTDGDATHHQGRVDYALFIDLSLVGIIEAKAMHKDIYAVIDNQCRAYAKTIRAEDDDYTLGTWDGYRVPFVFATNGRPYLAQLATKSGIYFLDLRDRTNTPQALRGWISPEGLEARLKSDLEKSGAKLTSMPKDFLTDPDGLHLRTYQMRAIAATEAAVLEGKTKMLLAMATGTGKTRTVLGMIYRFLKSDRFRRILFLVDRTSLGEQAQDVFHEVRLEDLQTLDQIYHIQGLQDTAIEQTTRVHVATVQSMVRRILYADGETMPAVSDYDLVIIDEAHRGYILDKDMADAELLYRDQRDYQSKYRSVIDYFDAVKIALTATPALQTTEIFGAPIYTYSYREAVIDGYLVDHDAPHRIETVLSKDGIHYKKGDTVKTYDHATGEIEAALIDDEIDFDVEKFNRDIINANFDRTVLEEIVKEINPDNPADGKTLIYAVDDAHADRIVEILREIFARKDDLPSDAIQKITGSIGDRRSVQEAIKRFKNEHFPSIVVTVDLLTTGIDVPEITNLIFLRRVKSRILFEQMLGRATRLCPAIEKTHFTIYDAVGVYDALLPVSTMKPIIQRPKATFTELIEALKDVDRTVADSIAVDILGKLKRKKPHLTDRQRETLKQMTEGASIDSLIEALDAARKTSKEDTKAYIEKHQSAFTYLDGKDQAFTYQKKIVLSDAPDRVLEHKQDYGKEVRPEDYLQAFEDYIKTHQNEIAALEIICTRPKDLTKESLRALKTKLDSAGFTELKLNNAIQAKTSQDITASIISLVRRYAIGSPLISHEARVRGAIERLCAAHDFTKTERDWLERIEKHILQESILSIESFDEKGTSFQQNGGSKRLNKIFKDQLANIVEEINIYLYDDGGKIA